MRSIFRFILLVCILLLPVYGEAEGVDVSLLSDGPAGVVLDVCPYRDGLGVLGTHGLFFWDPDASTVQKLLDDDGEILNESLLVPLEMELHLFQKSTGKVYHLERDQLTLCFSLPEEVFTYEDQGERVVKQVLGCAGGGDVLYILLNSFTFEQGDTYELYALDVATGSVKQLDVPGIQALWQFVDGKLLIGQEAEDGLHPALYDPLADVITQAWLEIDATGKTGLCWDGVGEVLYYTTDSGKVYAVGKDQPAFICAYLPFKLLYTSDKACLLDGSYAYLCQGDLFIRAIQEEGAEIAVLTIKGAADSQLLLAFAAEHPEIALNLQDRTNDLEDLQRALVQGDDSFDLYIVESDGLLAQVKDKGYAAPLNDSQALMEQAASFYPWVQEAIMDQDQLLALPASIEINCWTVNLTQWEKLGLGEQPETMVELFALMDRWQANYAEQETSYCLFQCLDGLEGILKDLVRQYLLLYETQEGPVTFDQADFRTVMEAALGYEDVFSSEGDQIPLLMSYSQYFGMGYNDSDLVASTLPLRLTESSPWVVRASMDLWVVNPASAQQEEAMLFLEFCMDHMDTQLRYRIDTSCTQPVRSSYYEESKDDIQQEMERVQETTNATRDNASLRDLQAELEQLNQRLQNLEENSWEISKEDVAIYQQIAPYVKVPLDTIYPDGDNAATAAIDQIISRYASRQLSLDDFIRMMDEKARMIYLEAR